MMGWIRGGGGRRRCHGCLLGLWLLQQEGWWCHAQRQVTLEQDQVWTEVGRFRSAVFSPACDKISLSPFFTRFLSLPFCGSWSVVCSQPLTDKWSSIYACLVLSLSTKAIVPTSRFPFLGCPSSLVNFFSSSKTQHRHPSILPYPRYSFSFLCIHDKLNLKFSILCLCAGDAKLLRIRNMTLIHSCTLTS